MCSEEFRTFVEHTEKELLSLFHSIDRDHNGKLDKDELKAAFKRARLAVPNSKLDQFFEEVDENHDVSSPAYQYLLLLTYHRATLPSLNGGMSIISYAYS
jgi:solute carrier family 25 phosphate transporter 23/24/25/41